MRGPALKLAIAGSLLAAGIAAAEPASGFKQRRRTERVTYFVAKGRKADVARTEAFLDRLETLFGAVPAGWHVDYYLHREPTLVHPWSGLAIIGVTDLEKLRIDSVSGYHPHELVHAVAGTIGRAPLFFAEGLAVALTSSGRWHGTSFEVRARQAMARSASLERYLTAFTEQDPEEAYAVAGSFVAYLLDRHGIDPMIGFLRRCGDGQEPYEAAFQRSYGRTVARATIEWLRALEETPSEQRAWYQETTWPASLRHALVAHKGFDGDALSTRTGVMRREELPALLGRRLAEPVPDNACED